MLSFQTFFASRGPLSISLLKLPFLVALTIKVRGGVEDLVVGGRCARCPFFQTKCCQILLPIVIEFYKWS
ncbi:hypothetical protein KP509_1Z315300 [Ceratopteris richardii]|nr:hypothetical protein KP509_1Z315300 [Ceratopteris richardii]